MIGKFLLFTAERHHRCRAALERDLADTVRDPVRKLGHMRRAAWHLRRSQREREHYLLY
jgi:hypothetical protein